MRNRALILLCLIVVCATAATTIVRVRRPVVAGEWYPAEAQELFNTARQHCESAPDFDAPGKMVACVVPHTTWPVSGPLAGMAFKHVKEGAYDRVIVLTASHYAKFRGASIPAVQFYETPLGKLPLDVNAINKINWNTLIDSRSISYGENQYARGARMPIHEREHAIESVLPFIQAKNGTFLLIPIVVGELPAYRGGVDKKAIESIAQTLREFIDDRTLVVVASHFTQYGEEYGFAPFRSDVLDKIEKLDLETIRFVLDQDLDGLLTFLDASKVPIDGAMPLAILTRLFPKRVEGELLRHTSSGRISGNAKQSVSFATLAFFDPDLEIPAGRAKPKATREDGSGDPLVPTESEEPDGEEN